ncbi:MAG: glycosyltransferase family 39 protein [Acidobacteria bacterium]|nr:glycosyltransferase family 39 protein [Acidobacteriota bacterium]
MTPALRGAALAALALSWALLLLGVRPLADPDEGRYAEAAREMIASRSPLVPLLDGRPHLTKPPVTYWLSAAGMLAFGRNEFGARIGSGLAFAASIAIAAALARRLAPGVASAGAWGALVLATSPLPYVGGSLLTTDALLAAAEGAALLAAAVALADASRRRLAVRWMWAALGLAFMVKGPPGLLPLAGVAVAWPRRADKRPGERWADGAALAIFAAIAGSWYVVVMLQDPARLWQFLWVEVYERVFTSDLRRDAPFWVPATVLAVGALPWALWIPRGLRGAGDGALARLLLAWLGAGLVVFTLSKSRMPLYVVPLVLALAVPAGAGVAAWARSPARRALALALAGACGAGLLLARTLGGEHGSYRHSDALASTVQARRAADEPILLLQPRLQPGLAFYLAADLVTVDLRRREVDPRADLRFDDLAGWLTARSGPSLAVGPEPSFAKLERTGFQVLDPVRDEDSGFFVARVGPPARAPES